MGRLHSPFKMKHNTHIFDAAKKCTVRIFTTSYFILSVFTSSVLSWIAYVMKELVICNSKPLKSLYGMYLIWTTYQLHCNMLANNKWWHTNGLMSSVVHVARLVNIRMHCCRCYNDSVLLYLLRLCYKVVVQQKIRMVPETTWAMY